MVDRTAPSRGDALVGVAATAVLLIELAGELDDDLTRPVLGLVLSLVMGGALATRRRYPLASYLASSAALGAQAWFVFVGGSYPFANLAAIYALGEHGERRSSWAALPVSAAGIAFYFSRADEPGVLPFVVFALWVAGWFAGLQVGRRRQEERGRQDETTRALLAEERGRIARDLHDQVGHAVTVMLVQAGAAKQVLTRDPERARASLEAIESVGQRTMVDLDTLLGTLRSMEDRVEEHAATVRALGIEVDVRREGRVPEPLVDVVGRVVQEALTNVVRHAGAGRALVDVRADDDRVVVVVEDDGVGGELVPGRGLYGMRERLAAVDGTLRATERDGGGTRLEAHLPTGPRP